MRVDRLQSRRHGPHHVGKLGIADMFDAVDMGNLDRNPVWPERRRPKKIINRCHHLSFLPTDTAMIMLTVIIICISIGTPETSSKFTLAKHNIKTKDRQSKQENTAEQVL